MAANKENQQKLNYRIKLLAGNNVVLVEADNHESEIFTPQMVNGRITLLNIIPNRRCCQVSKTNVMNFAIKESNSATPVYLGEQFAHKLGRMSAGRSYTAMSAPLANSTPAKVQHKNSCSSNLFNSNPYASSIDFSLPTPEPARRAIHARNKVLDKSMLNLPQGVKVPRIYHNSADGTPKKVRRLVSAGKNASDSRHTGNVSLLSNSFRLPCSPSISKNTSQRRSAPNVSSSMSADCIAKWQKVLTPVRTYTRKSNKPVTIHRPMRVENNKRYIRANKVIPSFLVNPTKGPNVTQTIEMKRRKLIIDKKRAISPKTFKNQQKQPVEMYKAKSHILQPTSLSFHKSQSYLKSGAMSAFDLLTNANRQRCMNSKLNKQFRKGCVNKAASTYSKYKVLSTVPPLKEDEQILKLSHISLERASSQNGVNESKLPELSTGNKIRF